MNNKEHKEENGILRDRIKELEEENAVQLKQLNSAFDRGYIPKSKVKEIVDLYNNTLQCTRKYNEELADILCDLEELLGDDK